MRTLGLLIAISLTFNALAQNTSAYLRSIVGQPWGNGNNELFMNDVFGTGQWDDLRFETVNVATLLSGHSAIFLDGSDSGADELEAFLTAHLTALESWVSSGGNLFINSAPNEGNGMSYGFGGTNLVNTTTPDFVEAIELLHPIFQGPHLPVGTNWSGNSFAHATITGTGLTGLISESGAPGQIVLAEKSFGAGRVLFGSMTTTNFHSPQPQADNLRRNILEYLKFNPVPLDAGVASVDSPSVFCAGTHNIIATIGNFGLDTIFSVTINWELNGVSQTPIVYSNPIDTIGSGNNTVSILLGSKTFSSGQIDTVKVWTSDPNGMADTVNFNDTLSVLLSPGLNGTYTIGGSSPDFATFSEVADILNVFGVCGPVIFNVRNGTYFEQISLGEIYGASEVNTITFQSESGNSSDVILTHESTAFNQNYTWLLSNSSWVIIQNMTLEATGLDYGRVISIIGDASNLSLIGNVIRGVNEGTTSATHVLLYCDSGVHLNCNISQNDFEFGSSGIYFFGDFNGGNYVSGLSITENVFMDQYYYGILISDLNNPVISDNEIRTAQNYPYFTGIEMSYIFNGFTVSKNIIEAPEGYAGLSLYDTYGTDSTECLTVNNFIHVGGDEFNTVYGIYAYCGTYQTFLHNSINVTGTSQDNQAVYLYAEGSGGESLGGGGCMESGRSAYLINNIVACTGAGYTIFADHPSAIDSSDYNDLFTTEGSVFAYNAGSISDLEDWQLTTGFDANSFDLNPGFIAPSGFEISEVQLNDAAVPNIPLTTVDIENESRSATTPDIGADEWVPPAVDAALLAFTQFPPPEGTSDVVVVLKNYGLNPLTTADLDWEVDSTAQGQVNWSGSLATGDTAHITLGQAAFDVMNTHSLKAWVSNPNMTSDPRPENDTIAEYNFLPGMSGVYTIGGTTPDFNTFSEALDALNIGGVAGPVTFLVRDGVYNEQLSFGPILGTSSSRPVVFTSESGDSTQVTLTHNSTIFNYTVQFNGADYVTFSYMTLQAENVAYGHVVELANKSDHITIEHSALIGISTTSSSANYAVIYAPYGTPNAFFTLRNSLLLNGSYGIYFSGSFPSPQGLQVIGNNFQNQYTTAAYAEYLRTPVFSGNTLTTNSTYCCYSGIYLYASEQGGTIEKNSIILPLYGIGVQSYYSSGTSAKHLTIANNFVYVGPGSFNSSQGFYLYQMDYADILFNTIHIKNTGSFGNAVPLYMSYGSNKTVMNNIFMNSGGGYAIYYGTGDGVIASDYNNYFSTGPNIGYDFSDIINLEDWQGVTGFDAHSFQLDPDFTLETSYVIREAFLNNAGTPLAAVTEDIENEARNISTPDIGADEWTPPALDAALAGFVNLPFPEGNSEIRVILKNNGSDTLTTATIDWTLDDVPQTTVNWTGMLSSGDTAHALLGTNLFSLGVPYSVKSWVSAPNGGMDAFTANDTIEINNSYPGLAGIYTIGGTSPDYNTFSDAVSALTTHGVAGPVTFMVRSGTYTEQLNITEFPGADISRPTLFRSESGDSTQVILSFGSNSANNYTVRFNGADWITFSHMTLQATNATYSRVVEITNGARHTGLENNIIIANNTSSTSSNAALILGSTSVGNDYLHVTNNKISGGAYGIYFPATSSHVTGINISGNHFENQYTYAIYLDEHNRPVVNYNNIITSSTYCCFRGIWLNDCNFGGQVIGNHVSIPLYGYGIISENWQGTVTDSSWVVNNFVTIGPGNTNTAYGLYLGFNYYVNALYNTVLVRNTQTGGSSIALYSYGGTAKVIQNNLLVNTGNGYAAYYTNTNGIVTADYNDYYTTGPILAYYDQDYATLTALQNASGKDANSINIDPLFVSNDDYKITEIDLDGTGIAIAGVDTDIEGDPRDSSTPDIGADEWTPAAVDAAISALAAPAFPFLEGTHDVEVVLKNNGVDTITSVDIDWDANLILQSQTQWSGMLASGDTTHVVLSPPQPFMVSAPVNLRVWASNPNGMGTDQVPSNDTLYTGDLYPALAGTYTIGGVSPDFATFSAAVLALHQGGIADTVRFLVRNGTYTEQLSIDEIRGSDSTRPIIFTSESGDSSLVLLTYSANSTNNYTVRLNGVDYITFSHMTLRSTHGTYNQVVQLGNGSEHVMLESLVLDAPVVTTTSSVSAVIFINSTGTGHFLTVTNSTIHGAAYGIYRSGGSDYLQGVTIANNAFSDQYYRGLLIYYLSSPVINNNLVETHTAYCCYTGIEVGSSYDGGDLRQNQVRTSSNGTGIYISGWYGTVSDSVWVVNNYVGLGGGNNTHYGIYVYDGTYVNLCFNTVDIHNTSVASNAFYNAYASSLKVRNNIFANRGGGHSVYWNTLPAVSDYNDLFATGTYLGFYNGEQINLSALQSATSRDVHSLTVDPFFIMPDDYPVAQSLLHNAGTQIPSVMIDIEGESRDMSPDIGADEFSLSGLDAGIASVVTPDVPFAAGIELVKAVLINHGSDTLHSVSINWTVNNVAQPPVMWNDTLVSGDTVLVDLNSVNFAPGVGINIKAWTSQPNSMADQQILNDTAQIKNIYGALSGVYTIGGPTPDFSNFSLPVNALNFGGIVGPVTFNVRDGVYNEQISLGVITGADNLNPVVFQSQNGLTATVTLTYNANSANNYTVRFNGADYVTFADMTLAATNTTYARVIEVTNASDHISLVGNVITAPATTSTSDLRALIYSNSTFLNEYLTITGNTLINGSYGIEYFASSVNVNGTLITDNTLTNQYVYGIALDEHNAPVISGNLITTNSTYTAYTGIYVNDSNIGGKISANTVQLSGSGYGIYFDDWFGGVADSIKVVNNFVSILGGTSSSYGIYAFDASYLYVYYNSVAVYNTNTSSCAFFHYLGSNKYLDNNIFANFGGGYAIYHNSSGGILESDYNDLYTTGTYLGFRLSNVADLTAWQSNTGDDGNSISDDPQYYSPTDLHVQNVLLNAAALSIPSITIDIDGEPRDALSPDIGADEFSTAPNDASVLAITNPVMPFAADVQSITVKIRNNGLDTLMNVNIDWEINGVAQPTFNWGGVLLSGQTEDSVQLGNFAFEIDTMYTIRAWTSNPNGMTDPETSNDTATVSELYAALGGIYTIGGSTPDFTSFTNAVTALNHGGVVSEVVFNVRDGNYSEQIALDEILGADSGHTITFQSESGDSSLVSLFTTSATSTNNYTLRLNGTDWVRFHQLTLRNNTTSFGHVIEITGEATNNIFSHNSIVGNNVTTTSTNEALVYSGNSLDDNNTFENNRFSEGSYGMYYFANSQLEEGTVILGNEFIGQYYMGVRLDNQDAPYLGFNTFTSNTVYCCTYFGVYTNACYNGLEYVNNRFYDIPEGYAFYILNADATSGSHGLVANNFIHIGSNTNNTNYGIYSNSSDYLDIVYNSINLVSTSTASRALVINSNFNTVLNNILYCSNQGYAIDFSSGSGFVSNHNDLYTENGANVGIWLGANKTALADWQAAGGQDANSVSVDPIYTSDADLHVAELDLNNTALPFAGITTDFDGDLRSPSTPDIGADEFDPITTNDALVTMIVSPSLTVPFPSGVQQITVEIKNNGADTLSSLSVGWTANGLPQTPFAWTGMLLPGDRENVVIGSTNFLLGFGNDLVAYTQNPNGQPDNRPKNDTASVFDLHPALSGVYTLGGSLPDFSGFADAAMALSKGGVLGPVTFNARNGTYNEQFVITQYYGASAANTVTFQSENGDRTFVKIEKSNSSGNNYLALLDGADYITFNELTFRPTGSVYSRGIELRNGANHNHIENCNFIDVNNGNDEFVYSSSSSVNNNTVVQNNNFNGGGNAISLSGQNTSTLETGTEILGNTFTNAEFAGIYLQYQNAPRIEQNTVSTVSTNTGYYGIACRYCDDAMKIIRNNITGGSGSGINLYRCDGAPALRGRVINNFVHASGTSAGYGIYTYEGTNLDFYFNSVNFSGTNTSSAAFYSYYGGSKTLLDNIFANTGGGWSEYVVGGSGINTANFNDLFTTGSNLGWWDNNTATDLVSWKAITGKDNNSLSVNPLFYSTTDLHVLQVALDSAGSSLAGILDDIDGDTRAIGFPDIGADEFDYLETDIGVVAILSPEEGCELTDNETVTVVIQNYGGLPQTGFDITYYLIPGPTITENVGGLVVMPGDTAHFTFTTKVDVSGYGEYEIESYTSLAGDLNPENDEYETDLDNFMFPDAVSNMLPANGTINVDPPINFSWLPSLGAERYDLYLWRQGDPVPSSPTGPDLTQITFAYNNASLVYGATYEWQVVAKNDFCATAGAIQTFTLRELPDLIVSDVDVPATAFSGQTIEVTWEVMNQAIGGTGMSTWYDYIYLSSDAIYQDGVDQYLGGFANLTALNSGESYSNMKTVMLPNGIQGNYYIFVFTDRNNQLIEGNNSNNISAAAVVPVTLTPPPDLRVTSVIPPNQAFSGTSINVSWTVTNNGPGNVLGGTHSDRIYISDSQVFSVSNATVLKTVNGLPALNVGNSYTQNTSVTIPAAVFGIRFIHVVTDINDQVFEFAFESNNSGTSDTMDVILTPPPDLVVTSITAPPSVDNRENVVLQWTVQNQGATATSGTYYDRIWISMLDTFNMSQATSLAQAATTSSLGFGGSINRSVSITIPASITGTYYLYVQTDAFNSIFEFDKENNNITRSNGIQVLNADLVVSNINISDTTFSGVMTPVEWTVTNQGMGDVQVINRTDKVYLSTVLTLNIPTATYLGSLSYSDALNASQNLVKQMTFALPNGIMGKYYIHVITDSGNDVFENLNEGNNTRTDSTWIKLSPWPDLRVDTLKMLPDTAMAGDMLTVEFDVRNHGLANILSGLTWSDKVFISANPNWNPADASLLKTINISQALSSDSTYTQSASFTLPMLGGGATTGTRYIYVYTDHTNKIYEHTDEGNNFKRSAPIFVTTPAPVDFKIMNASTLPDTVYSGDVVNLQWMIRNNGSSTALWNYQIWYDGVYFSPDSVQDYYADVFVKDFTKQGPVAHNGVYTQNQNFSIPYGISGDYYVFLTADHTHLTNNSDDMYSTWKVRPASYPSGYFKPIYVVQKPSPDLEITTAIAPTAAIAGQPIQVIWTVQNVGMGATSGNWTDKIYLSTDFTIDFNDPIIATRAKNLVLQPGGSYTDTIDAFIPINKVGNFIVIVKADANNKLFEYNGEDNNTFYSFLTTSLPLPSDLIVSGTNFDSAAVVGEQFSIQYTLYNQGLNPASGVMQDLIYFSPDSVFDVTDVKFTAPVQRNINIGPALSSPNTVMRITPGVPLGEYFVIVQTDILNNIYENSDLNNVYISPNKVMVSVQELPLDSIMADSLMNDLGLYYRVEIADSLDGEALLVLLDSHTPNSVNELYLSYQKIPTRSVHDFAFSDPFTDDQEIIVPEVQPGTYYLLAYGATTYGPASGKQSVDLFAEIVPFEIRDIVANKGSNSGKITVRLEGARFVPDMEVRLQRDTIVAVGQDLLFINSTVAYVTFNLAAGEYIDNWIRAGLPAGFYDVMATKKSGETTILIDGFEVVDEANPSFSVSLSHPPNTRVNRIVAMTLNYGNDGNVDIPVPRVSVVSLRGAPVALTPAELSYNFQDVSVELRETGGPPDVLRPGAIGSVTIYAKSSQPMTFKLVRLE